MSPIGKKILKRSGVATVAASGLTASILGLAAPAQAASISDAPNGVVSATTIATDIGHHGWVHDNQHHVEVPEVDTSVQHHP